MGCKLCSGKTSLHFLDTKAGGLRFLSATLMCSKEWSGHGWSQSMISQFFQSFLSL